MTQQMGIGSHQFDGYVVIENYCNLSHTLFYKLILMIPIWMKPKRYLHLTPSLSIYQNWKVYKSKIENESFVARYAFFPLIHSEIKERKYKLPDPNKHLGSKRSHVHRCINSNKVERTIKHRPLHYASHFDALIYSYYAYILNEKLECELKKDDNIELNKAIIAYRKIKIDNEERGKSTIHFAKEVFDEIKQRTSSGGSVAVLAFDIKKFFPSLDHEFLKRMWIELVGEKAFQGHHFNVFNACTNFSYVLLNDLKKSQKGKAFDERELAKIRRENGYKCFFHSIKDFRIAIKQGRLKVYKNPFFDKSDIPKRRTGIPQGLALSATLANIYLLNFDKFIISELVNKRGAFYRRYSDDLIVICRVEEIEEFNNIVQSLIEDFKLKISAEKTEKFIFEFLPYNNKGDKRLTCIKLLKDGTGKANSHLTYLGFEFRGYNTTIKSSNLAKYYRKIISVVRRRAKRANASRVKDPSQTLAIYLSQIKKLINKPIKIKDSDKADLKQQNRGNYKIIQKENGMFTLVKHQVKTKPKVSNYYSYVKRCSEIFKDKIFLRQIRKRKKITYMAINKQLNKYQ